MKLWDLLRLKGHALAIALLLALGPALGCAASGAKKSTQSAKIKIYALKYGEGEYRSALVNTLETQPRIKFGWLFYLVAAGDEPEYTLIDTGFSDKRLLDKFGVRNHSRAEDLLAWVGVRPEQINRVILTHTHFDHARDVTLFPNAEIYLQQREFDALLDRAIAPFLSRSRAAGKLRLLHAPIEKAGPFEILFSGGHTAGAQTVRLTANSKRYLFTGDECYFQDACHARVPLPAASAYSRQKNAEFLRTVGDSDIILAGHEANLSGGRWLNDFVYLFDQ